MPVPFFGRLVFCAVLSAAATAAWCLTDAPSPAPTTAPAAAEPGAEPSAAQQAQAAYDEGLKLLKEADAAPVEQARSAYLRARKHFDEATRLVPQMPEAWNATGYSQRKLGNYAAALAAYDLALQLKPGYPEATEYRGEALLALNRIEDAKQAYLDLFAGNRTFADQLLTAMKGWIASRRASPAGVASATLDELEKWVDERSHIAAQTASLMKARVPAPGWETRSPGSTVEN